MAYTTPKSSFKKHENRRLFRRNALSGLALGIIRGIGMALGFSGLAVVLLAVTRIIPLQKIPVVGDIINALIKR